MFHYTIGRDPKIDPPYHGKSITYRIAIPAHCSSWVRDNDPTGVIEIVVDVRHEEMTKLKDLGFSHILTSLVNTFCHEFLGPHLRKWSPKFFGSGAVNFEELARRRSELWVLVGADVEVVGRSGEREILRASDIHLMRGKDRSIGEETRRPKIILIANAKVGTLSLDGFYLRVPETAYRAYGDLIPQCEDRAAVWAGDRILFVTSDGMNAAFQYEIRLDRLIVAGDGVRQTCGSVELSKPVQQLFKGVYLPIPPLLEKFLVPTQKQEVRILVNCDWIDMASSKRWTARVKANRAA
jgi:hypothetical protein